MSNGRWFRFYDDTLNDPKSLKLSDKTFRIWVGMLCAASKNDGILQPFDDLLILLRIRADKLQPAIEELITAELIDHDDSGLHPHNWNTRQYKSDVSTERVKRFRNGERNVSETPPETDTESKTETEQKDTSLRSVDDWPDDFREAFWKLYPLKKGKQAAVRELERVRKRGILWQKLIDAVRAYAATADPQFTKHPKTWLSQGCWDDEPDTRKPHGKTSIIDATQKLIDGIEAFGSRPCLIRSSEGENPVRMLSNGGGERSRDVHGGDSSNPIGIPGGSNPACDGPEDGDSPENQIPAERS